MSSCGARKEGQERHTQNTPWDCHICRSVGVVPGGSPLDTQTGWPRYIVCVYTCCVYSSSQLCMIARSCTCLSPTSTVVFLSSFLDVCKSSDKHTHTVINQSLLQQNSSHSGTLNEPFSHCMVLQLYFPTGHHEVVGPIFPRNREGGERLFLGTTNIFQTCSNTPFMPGRPSANPF